MNNKGQLTLFIILGIFLILVIVLLFLFKGYSRDADIDLRIIEDVPIEVLPLQQYIDSCVQEVATRGIVQAGEHGGYIDPEEFVLIAQPNPTTGSAVEFLPGYTIPYWWHMKSANTCVENCAFETQIPPLRRDNSGRSIEEQLDRYMTEKFRTCVGNFHQFTQQGFAVEEGDITATTRIRDTVQVAIEYPLKVSTATTTHSLRHFSAELPVNIEKIYAAAVNLTMEEVEQQYLEKNTLDLINIHAGLDADRLPPMTATDFTTTPIVWVKNEVERHLREILEAYTPVLRIKNTINAPEYQLPDSFPYSALVKRVTQAVIDHMTLPLTGLEGYAVNFYYFSEWPVYFEMDHQGGLIQPESGLSDIIPGINFGIQRYNGIYDVSYPSVVEIHDPSAFNEEGFSWKFALEANIRNNAPLTTSSTTYQSPNLADASLFCDRRAWNSGDVTVTVRDDNGPVADAQVLFSSIDTCAMGTTDAKGKLHTAFPIGLGQLRVLERQHLRSQQPVQTYLDQKQEFVIELSSLRDVSIIGRKAISKNIAGSWSQYASGVPLEDGETLFIAFDRENEDGVEDYQTAVTASANSPGQVQLAEGIYTIRVVLVKEGEVTYLPISRCTQVGELLSESEVCVTYPEEETTLPVPSLSYELQWEYDGRSSVIFTGATMDVMGAATHDLEQDIEYANAIQSHVKQQSGVFQP